MLLRWERDDLFQMTTLYNAPGDLEDAQDFEETPRSFPLTELEALTDINEYGRRLGDLVFRDQARVLLDRALQAAESMPITVRLSIDSNAPIKYQAVKWETICRPGSGERLSTKNNVHFYRYLSNAEGKPATPLPREGRLKALVVVANPSDIADFAGGFLTPVDVKNEIERARSALGEMSITVLAGDGARATRTGIFDALRNEYHLLYLVCHGRIDAKGGPVLFLENNDGRVDTVSGRDFATSIADLDSVPTIAVLCSCQSGGPTNDILTSTAKSLTATGPAMASAGIAVVVAMQGNVTMKTASDFLQRFFQELNEDGIPHRAMAVARSTISNRPDWFMPVLFSRLKRGRAWYRPRFGGREQTLFRNLHTRISRQKCTPFVGSGVADEDDVLPSRQALARQWALARQMPLSVTSQGDLASAAQFVSVEDRGGAQLARDELDQLLRRDLRVRFSNVLGDVNWRQGKLHDLVRAAGQHMRQSAAGKDNYSMLAHLDLPIYVTTSWSYLLEDALVDTGKIPVTRHFNWYDRLPNVEGDRLPNVEDDEEMDEFSPGRPLVYHLFGTLEVERSLVLTEDDYFAWLRQWTKQTDKGAGIPHYVKFPLTQNTLMFLGYEFDDWEFRMVFHAIKGFEGRHLDATHVGVQLRPETLNIEREAAQEYLESYLGNAKIDLYWQRCAAFLQDLYESRPVHD